jgi:hypothetical protein
MEEAEKGAYGLGTGIFLKECSATPELCCHLADALEQTHIPRVHMTHSNLRMAPVFS